jgi:adenosine deaminase
MRSQFIEALHKNSILDLQKIYKSDLHNHAGRGGNIRYIEAWANVTIEPSVKPFDSLSKMQEWFEHNVKCHCAGLQGYLKRIEAAFVQAHEDSIKVLAMSFGIGEIDTLGGMEAFSKTISKIHKKYAPNTKFYPELALGRESNIDDVISRLDEIFSYNWFKSIDICNNEFAQPIRNFKGIYKLAKSSGLRLKAHVGEFGSADDVMEAVEELELNEVHHGIAAAKSVQIMRWLADNKIQLNVCPTSNIMLKVVDSYSSHPIRKLYDYSVPITINTDDLLIFNQSISQEYLNLYNCNLMTAEELDKIRERGLVKSFVGEIRDEI